MSSTNFVDFSVRQNKSIERLIVFENLRRIIAAMSLTDIVYVGLGSVWFSDFLLAHRELGIESMISIEADSIIHKRAIFNSPYRTVEVVEGLSAVVIPLLLKREELGDRPWIVWLDYDAAIDESRRDEVAFLIRNLPPDSLLIVTCNAQYGRYGRLAERVELLEELFGDAVESGLENVEVKSDTSFMDVLRSTLERFMLSTALTSARPGGYEPAFNIAYQDGTPMITVGGFLPSPSHAASAAELIGVSEWTGRAERAIITPPLTSREVSVLQAQLPRGDKLTRSDVQALGFDLEESQIESFVCHYLKFPTFAQVSQ